MRSVLYPVLFVLDVLRASSFPLFLIFLSLTFLRPIDVFAPEWLDSRPMMWLLLLAFSSGILAATKRRQLAARPIHFFLLVAFTFVIMISVAINGWIGGATTAAGEFSASAFLYLLAALNLNSVRRIRVTSMVILLTMVAAALLSTYSYYTGFHWQMLVLQQGRDDIEGFSVQPDLSDESSVIPAEDTTGNWLWRIRGINILNDPNDFAQMLVAVMPFLWTYVGGRPRGKRGTALSTFIDVVNGLLNRIPGSRTILFVLPLASILLYAIYLTHSRGAVLGLAALMFFTVQRRLGNARSALLIALVGLASLAINVGGGRDMSLKESSADDRIGAWGLALQLFKTHPLLGVGYGNFTEYNALTAHNSFVLCFAELGIIGYFVWMAMIVITYLGVQRVLDNTEPGSEHHRMAWLLRSSLVGYLTCAWFLSRTYSAGLYFLLAMGAAMAYSLVNDAATLRQSRQAKSRANDVEPTERTLAASAPPTSTTSTTSTTSPATPSAGLAYKPPARKSKGKSSSKLTTKPLRRPEVVSNWLIPTIVTMGLTMTLVEIFVLAGRSGGG